MGAAKSNQSKEPDRSNASTDYPDDFDEEDKNDRSVGAGHNSGRRTSGLNPDAPAFFPNSNPQAYQLKNKRTELIFSEGDLLKTKAHAIVYAGKEQHSRILKAVGRDCVEIYQELGKRSNNEDIPVGHSRIIPSGDVKNISYIIWTVPPQSDSTDSQLITKELRLCYETSLELANLYDLESIAFAPIGCEGADKSIDMAIRIALETVNDRAQSLKRISFICPNQKMYDRWVAAASKFDFNSPDNKENKKGSTKTK